MSFLEINNIRKLHVCMCTCCFFQFLFLFRFLFLLVRLTLNYHRTVIWVSFGLMMVFFFFALRINNFSYTQGAQLRTGNHCKVVDTDGPDEPRKDIASRHCVPPPWKTTSFCCYPPDRAAADTMPGKAGGKTVSFQEQYGQ